MGERMICRIWRGWTSKQNADGYQAVVRGQVIPDIEARNIPGFRHIDLMRHDHTDEVEFTTLMWFDSLDAVRDFMGEDYTASHVPATARAVLSHFDSHAVHHEVIDRRVQS
ncbi:antibiotic biosynthesis monooxygenase [Mesorhizobium sp. INR15]|uniref:antibiotic biosynthesis monooxygenase n=1 Tax=Mesorhizobium sp. INR15 TaxID=2654248 RepID=UPI0021560264|nr:antibiotic biosynthesis monooxygenase [Mesorhizobium sp. INR15]